MSRLDNNLISRKALLEAIKNNGTVSMSDATKVSECVYYDDVIDLITKAPTIESEASSRVDSGEADAEVYSTAVYPNSNGMYEHTFLFNDRLAQQTELYLYNPNKCKKQWVELTDSEISDLSREMVKGNKSVNWLAGKIQALLKEVNHG